jgi:hypothetical protein
MLNNLFGSPSCSYAQKTPPRSRHPHTQPPNVPLPPSPSPLDNGSKTPGLGLLDGTFSPGPDLLLTPDRTLSPSNGLQSSRTMSSFETPTPTRSGAGSGEGKRKETLDTDTPEDSGRKGPPVLEDFELVRVIGKGCAGRVSRIS